MSAAVRSLVSAEAPAGRSSPQATESLAQSAPSSEPQWRLELTRKIEAYRARRGQPEPALEPQARLPFPPAMAAPPAAAPPQRPRTAQRRHPERVEIFVTQSGFDFSEPIPSPNHALVPVASLGRRALAWWVDMGVLVLCWAMFLAMLTLLGVRMTERKIDLVIAVAILSLLYAQYFGLFTSFGGATPGMRVAGLRPVGFDGNPPTPKQLLWRSFGYLVAASAGFLGFLWALWDEDRLCWQDRVSQTYLTAMAPLVEPPLAGKPTYPHEAV